MTVNRRKWDESVPLHVDSPSYEVQAFKNGQSSLQPIEIELMGSVKGRSLLHLQCHFGMDTLSWARRGAVVTGVDYSPAAVQTARELALELGISASFVESNVYDLPRRLHRKFDVVYTGKGILCWLPDLPRWGRVIARFLRPGGRLLLIEDHPFSDCFDNVHAPKWLVLKDGYFEHRPSRFVFDGTYATSAKMRNKVMYEWPHSASEILNSLTGAGLRLDSVQEYPFTFWRKFPFLVRGAHGYRYLPRGDRSVPLMWSVLASAPE